MRLGYGVGFNVLLEQRVGALESCLASHQIVRADDIGLARFAQSLVEIKDLVDRLGQELNGQDVNNTADPIHNCIAGESCRLPAAWVIKLKIGKSWLAGLVAFCRGKNEAEPGISVRAHLQVCAEVIFLFDRINDVPIGRNQKEGVIPKMLQEVA